MTTLQVGDEPTVNAWLQQRRAMGVDGRDEIWEGVYRVAPYEHSRNSFLMSELLVQLSPRARRAGLHGTGPFNLGEPGDFRIPDAGFHRTREWQLYLPTAALVVEVLSPGDGTWEKLPFYAAHGVDEVWIVDPVARTLAIRTLVDGGYVETVRSELLRLPAATVMAELDWP